ncbi:MAG: ABC transporter permease [Candidatus Limnocylindrales bacterium]
MTAATGARSGAIHVLEHQLFAFRRTWRGGVFSTFLAPVLFLAAMGLGLGTFVDEAGSPALEGVAYLVFLAPGLLASQAMQVAAGESMYPIMSAITWNRTFQSMTSAPLTVPDVVLGVTFWLVIRLALVCTVFVAVSVVFGAMAIGPGIVMIPVAILTGLAFALPISAFTATQRTDQAFPVINRFVIIPLFIFSGTFFPIDQLPALLQPIAWLTPLWNGVSLARGIALGGLDPLLALWNLVVLVTYCGVGLAAALVTFRRRLVE